MTTTLADIRAAIDDIDTRIVLLIAERQRWVEAAGALKASTDAVRAPARVEQVVETVRARATAAGASADVAEATYRAMIGAFIDHELRAAGFGHVSPDAR